MFALPDVSGSDPIADQMELSPLMRNLISRGAALVVGLLLLWPGIYFLRGVRATEREAAVARAMHPDQQPPDRALGTIAVFAMFFCGPSMLFIGFALLPTRLLYALPLVSPPPDMRSDSFSTHVGWFGW